MIIWTLYINDDSVNVGLYRYAIFGMSHEENIKQAIRILYYKLLLTTMDLKNYEASGNVLFNIVKVCEVCKKKINSRGKKE